MKTSSLFRRLPRLLPAASLAALALFAGGCTAVRVAQPVGEKPLVLDRADWEGTWITESDEGAVEFKVADAAKGELLLLSIVKDKDGKPTLSTMTILLRESGGWLFGSVVAEDDKDRAKDFLWGRIMRENDQILIWKPDVGKFQELVGQGKLKEVKSEGGDLHLEAFSAADLKALTTGALGVPFEWDRPMVLRRVAKSHSSDEPPATPPAPARPTNPDSPSAQNSATPNPPAR